MLLSISVTSIGVTMLTPKNIQWGLQGLFWHVLTQELVLSKGMLAKYSVQFSRSVVSDYLLPHGLQHTRPPCLSPTPIVYSNSCPLSRWCHPTISSSVIPFSSCLQSFPDSGSFPMSQVFESGSQTMEFWLQHQSFQWTLRTDLL